MNQKNLSSFNHSLNLQKEYSLKRAQQDRFLKPFHLLPGFLKGDWSLEKREELQSFFASLSPHPLQWGSPSHFGDFQVIPLLITWEDSKVEIWSFLQKIPPLPLILKELSWKQKTGGHLKIEWIDSKVPHPELKKPDPPSPLLDWGWSPSPAKQLSSQAPSTPKGYLYMTPDKWVIWRAGSEIRSASETDPFLEVISHHKKMNAGGEA